MRLDGKVAVITGAAVGIQGELMNFGGNAGWRFTEEGARVVLTDVNDEKGEATAAQIREAGGDAVYMHHDVSQEADWDRVIEATLSRHGKLDVLINNAGGGGGGGHEITSDSPVDVFRRWMDVNSTGTFLGIRAAIDPMKAAGGGSIINMSSIYGLIGGPSPPSYLASKGAIRNLTKGTAVQLAPYRIRVNSVHPGFAFTAGTCNKFSDPDEAAVRLARVPMGRFGTVDEIVYALRLPRLRRIGMGHRRRTGYRRRADGGVAIVPRSRSLEGV